MCTDEEIRQEYYETALYGFSVIVQCIQDMPEHNGECPIQALRDKCLGRISYKDIDKMIEECKLRGTVVETRKGFLKVVEQDDLWNL